MLFDKVSKRTVFIMSARRMVDVPVFKCLGYYVHICNPPHIPSGGIVVSHRDILEMVPEPLLPTLIKRLEV